MHILLLKQEIQDRLPSGWIALCDTTLYCIMVFNPQRQAVATIQRTAPTGLVVVHDNVLFVTDHPTQIVTVCDPTRVARLVGARAHELATTHTETP